LFGFARADAPRLAMPRRAVDQFHFGSLLDPHVALQFDALTA
jgi:hypothetical protein